MAHKMKKPKKAKRKVVKKRKPKKQTDLAQALRSFLKSELGGND